MMESSTLPNKIVVAASADMVSVASHVDNNHKSVEVTENGRTVRRCTIYPNISCEDHVRTSEVGKKYLSGRFATPVMIWCDPKGKELFRNHGIRSPEEFQKDVKSAADKVPGTRIAKADYDRQAIPLEDAEAAFKEGKYKPAIEGFTAAAKGAIEALRKAAEKGLADLQRIGQNLLDRGRKAVDSGRKDQGLELLKIVAEQFGALECGRQAAEILKKHDSEGKEEKK